MATNERADRIRMLKTLTQQQRRILELLCEEMPYRHIAAALGRGTPVEQVERQAAQIFTKLGITSQPNRAHHDEVRRYGDVIQFLEAHRKPPPGMSEGEIEEVRHAPDDGRDQPAPRWATMLARQYGEELESGRNVPSVRNQGTATDPPPPGSLTRGVSSAMTAWTPPEHPPESQPSHAAPSPVASGSSRNQVMLMMVGVAVIALLAGALVVSMSRGNAPQVAPPPQIVEKVITATPAPVAKAAPAPTQAPPTQAAPATPKPAPPTSTPLPLLTPTTAPINMLGRVPSDRPGAELQLGDTVTSVLDASTKKIDAYEFQLSGGQTIKLTLTGLNVYLKLYPPDFRGTFPNVGDVRSISDGAARPRSVDFTSAVNARYPVIVYTLSESGARYTLRAEEVR